MISSERQYRRTAAEIRRFEQAIAGAEEAEPARDEDRRLHEAMIAGMKSQLEDLRDELARYEAERKGETAGSES